MEADAAKAILRCGVRAVAAILESASPIRWRKRSAARRERWCVAALAARACAPMKYVKFPAWRRRTSHQQLRLPFGSPVTTESAPQKKPAGTGPTPSMSADIFVPILRIPSYMGIGGFISQLFADASLFIHQGMNFARAKRTVIITCR